MTSKSKTSEFANEKTQSLKLVSNDIPLYIIYYLIPLNRVLVRSVITFLSNNIEEREL